MNLFPLVVSMFSLFTAIGIPGTPYVRRHPDTSHRRVAWWFMDHRRPAPEPVRFFFGPAAAILSWSLNAFVVGVAGQHGRAPAWLVTLAAAVALLSVAALSANLVVELRDQRRSSGLAPAKR